MTSSEFFDALKALYFVEAEDLRRAGLHFDLDMLRGFRSDPPRFMRAQRAPIQEAVFSIIVKPKEPK